MGVCLLGGHPGRLFPARDWLGFGTQARSRTDASGVTDGAQTAAARTPVLVYHSDRGVQYASHDYTQLLQQHGVGISMSRKANPWDNTAGESFIKTLKNEEVPP